MSQHKSVTVIGLGSMGAAMARTFLQAGYDTTVWNRTTSKAKPLAEAGARLADSAATAVAANELIVVSQVDIAAMFDSLAEADLTGKVIANLSSDTPNVARQAAEWVTARGGTFLSGGMMVPPPMIGGEDSYCFHSGPETTLTAHREALSILGRVEYLGEDIALAQLYYQAQLTIFWSMLTGYMHATALIGSAGHSAEDAVRYASSTVELGGMFVRQLADEIDAGSYPGGENNLHMQAVGAGHVLHASRDAGLNTALPQALKTLFDTADNVGHGQDSLTAMIEAIRPRR